MVEAPVLHFKPQRSPSCSARVYYNVFSYTLPRPAVTSKSSRPGRRGKIRGFSKKSRSRLMRLLGEIRYDLMGIPYHVTLTFHRRPENPFAKFHALRQWMHRRGIRAVWKLELQKRGVEHFHLLVWGDEKVVRQIKRYWHKIAAEGSFRHSEYGAKVDKVDSPAGLVKYLAKYLGKGDISERDGGEIEGHRYWGVIGKLCRDPFDEAYLNKSQAYILRRIVRRLKRARARAKFGKGRVKGYEGLRGDWVFLNFIEGFKLLEYVRGLCSSNKRGGPLSGGRAVAVDARGSDYVAGYVWV